MRLLAVVIFAFVASQGWSQEVSFRDAMKERNRAFLKGLVKFEIVVSTVGVYADLEGLRDSFRFAFKDKFQELKIPGTILPEPDLKSLRQQLNRPLPPVLLVTIEKMIDGSFRLDAALHEDAILSRNKIPFRAQTWTYRAAMLQKSVDSPSYLDLLKEKDKLVSDFCLDYLSANRN